MTLWLLGTDADFSGQGGDVLHSALRAAGLGPASVRFERYAPETIATVLRATPAPTVIVAFGAEPCARLIGDAWPSDGIQATRGYLWDTPYGRVLSAMAPSAVVREWTPWRALLDFDLRRAKAELDAGAPTLTTRGVTVVTSERELAELRDAVRGCPLLSVDIENTHDLQLACCGFAPTPERAWVIPAVEGWQLDAIRALCESEVPKVLQNGQYDRFFLRRFAGIELRNHAFDTMLAWHCIAAELAGKKTDVGYKKAKARRTAKSLKFLASIYLRVPFWKNYSFASEYERYVLCGNDVCNTLEIAEKQIVQLGTT